ncbi:hypothetical protein HRW23_24620 [Streptomyces lunaelactis]|uniref:hypothetical protein n=1 Tax=Streptomyces lunaelactis TaxID=1535768 RepID=UPI0015859B14|nr:hypothetical protein [Streptomyces lunaelactis]NUK10372.1 hypothetical protein [Streptomyces lunaelactis]NUK37260.1 hypothetical protein [Streptomyces lunaelactis]NUK44916.1 hypothetical protein [Streptomyces lunaelactis]NUK73838.1 hypothetical protein [Streptomyces lunaelactis]NUK80511.1 hypothetical protein [Streptomyces lunaelactis]
MTTTGSGKERPGLAISVYRVDPETKERTPVKASVLPAAKALPFSMAYPPCACPRCSQACTR